MDPRRVTDGAREAEAPAGPRVVKDTQGNVLADGDGVILIKDLRLGGSSVLKGGSKSKPIRLVDGIAAGRKACFAKKA